MYLICEGKCNDSISDVDDRVTAFREVAEKLTGDRLPAVPSEVAVKLQSLHHTHHIGLGPDIFKCTECSGVRRFGNTI